MFYLNEILQSSHAKLIFVRTSYDVPCLSPITCKLDLLDLFDFNYMLFLLIQSNGI